VVLLDSVPGTLFLKTLDSNRYLAIPLELLESVPGTAGSCAEVYSLKDAEGAKAAASSLVMSLATFYRHRKENLGRGGDEPFL